jgi:hypothetical protein
VGLTIALAAMLVVAGGAFAARGGNGGGKGGKGATGTSSLALVMLDPADGQANFGDRVTFDVSTTATDRPFVRVDCYQGPAWVYVASVGYFDGYPWAKEFTLAANSWPGGAADCMATLYLTKDGSRTTTLATLPFGVAA